MLAEQKEKLQKVVELIDNVGVNPDVAVDYFIPGVLVTEGADGSGESGGPYISSHINLMVQIHMYSTCL